MNAFSVKLGEHVEAYVALRRALGFSLAKQAAILRALVGYVDAVQHDGPLCRRTVLGFIYSWEGTANGRAARYGVVRRFTDYLAIFEPGTDALDPKAFPRNRAIPPPRILTDCELARLMAACRSVSPDYPERARFLTPLVGLLASTGMRSGEALRLDRSDVDLTDGILHIRRTKFRKDRLVPVHSSTLAVLGDYARHRDATFSALNTSAFFISSRGTRLSQSGLREAFRAARRLAGLDKGKPLRPHDLRHRFAITRLAIWHRERVDVRAMLPVLATYLGHGRYSDTAYYVTAGADLLAIAAERALAWGETS
ncbi:tyrosine-type recombinase/integrase [Sphingobium chungbukense]|uniref:Integrase n=1 Tax=Sphingobium chungbukense TaxID=56193 RepID=A0A0M3APX4_9SPHN|nr:tyrosine-type recombinase/integrase [Sphingobium chungbukense]KKW90594.1 integrase [Sphingobium chungbukense]